MNKKVLTLVGCLAILSVPVVSWADTQSNVEQPSDSVQPKLHYLNNWGYSINAVVSNDGYMVVELKAPQYEPTANSSIQKTYFENVNVVTVPVEYSFDGSKWKNFAYLQTLPSSKPIFERVPLTSGTTSLEIAIPDTIGKGQVPEFAPYLWMTISYSSDDGFTLHDDH